jgi:hypothetical protein
VTIFVSAQNKVLHFNGTRKIGTRLRKIGFPPKINSAIGADGSDENQMGRMRISKEQHKPDDHLC